MGDQIEILIPLNLPKLPSYTPLVSVEGCEADSVKKHIEKLKEMDCCADIHILANYFKDRAHTMESWWKLVPIESKWTEPKEMARHSNKNDKLALYRFLVRPERMWMDQHWNRDTWKHFRGSIMKDPILSPNFIFDDDKYPDVNFCPIINNLKSPKPHEILVFDTLFEDSVNYLEKILSHFNSMALLYNAPSFLSVLLAGYYDAILEKFAYKKAQAAYYILGYSNYSKDAKVKLDVRRLNRTPAVQAMEYILKSWAKNKFAPYPNQPRNAFLVLAEKYHNHPLFKGSMSKGYKILKKYFGEKINKKRKEIEESEIEIQVEEDEIDEWENNNPSKRLEF